LVQRGTLQLFALPSHPRATSILFGRHGCWEAFFVWHAKTSAHNTNRDDWEARGYFDACDVNREFAKHWNSSYPIHDGLVFYKGCAGRAFHSGDLITVRWRVREKAVGGMTNFGIRWWTPRGMHWAYWTGTQMLLWGGAGPESLVGFNDDALFTPE
jgi:hypothetical protein